MFNKSFNLLIVTLFFSLTNSVFSQLFINSGQNLGNGRIFSVVLGDLDGDNDSDAVIVDYLSYSKIWFNDGLGHFTDSGQIFGVPSQRGHGAAIGDLENDGDNDIFFVNNEGPNQVLLNDGNGVFTNSEQQLGTSSDAYLSVVLSDVDGDNDLDALLASFFHHGELWLNDGSGVFANSGQNIGNDEALRMGVDDLDGDNDPDIVLNNFNNYDEIWFNDGSGNFTNSGQTIGDIQSWGHIALSDVDNDGDVDAFITNYESGSSKVWVNNGEGTFSELNSYSGNGEFIAMEDLNNDGNIDAIICGVEKFIKIWINDGIGNFIYSGTLGYNGISLFFADVDSDTDTDVAIGYMEGSGGNKIFLNETINGLKEKSSVPTGFKLLQNYPNPFNPATKISYQIPKLSFVTLKVYDVLGNEIATLVNGENSAGTYEVEFNSKGLINQKGIITSGVYFYQLKVGSYIQTKKMILMR
jgi:hypothetical protein